MRTVENCVFAKFLEAYKNRLIGEQKVSLEELLEQSKSNYRIKRLTAFYFLKNKNLFLMMLNESKTDKFAENLLNTTMTVLITVSTDDCYGTPPMKKLVNAVMERAYLKRIVLNSRNNVDTEGNTDLVEYYKFLNDYVAEKNKRSLSQEFKLRVNERIKLVNLDNLFV